MSEIRLVRCPKCSKVLPEPPQVAVYQCGACGTVLQAKRSTLGDKEREGKEGLGGSREGLFDQEGALDMGSRSPARSTVSERPTGKSDFIFGGFPKSPMRDRFLNDLGSAPNSPTRSRDVSRSPMRERASSDFDFDQVGRLPGRLRNVSRSPMRERASSDFDFDRVGRSPGRLRNVSNSAIREKRGRMPMSVRSRDVSRSPMREERTCADLDNVRKSPARSMNGDNSKSPMRESGVRTPVSVRSRHVSRSPMREERAYADLDGVSKSPARSMNGDTPKSPMKRDNVFEFDNSAEAEQEGNMGGHSGVEEEARDKNMSPKTSFNVWLPDDKQSDNYPSRRRTWRDRVGNRFDQVSEGREPLYNNEHDMVPEGTTDYPTHKLGPSKEMVARDLRFRSDNVGGYAKSRATANHRVPGKDRVGVIRGRTSASSSTGDAPSNYCRESTYGYGDPRHSLESMRGPASVQDLELERAELLQKYNKLKEQLGDLDDDRFSSPGLYNGPDDYSEAESWRFKRGSVQQFAPDKSVHGPPFFNHTPGPVHNMADMYDFEDPSSVQVTRGPRPKQPHQFLRKQIPRYAQGRSLDFDQDPLESYYEKTHYHHPACTCSLCYVNNWQGQDPNSLAATNSANLAARNSANLAARNSANLAANHRVNHSMDLERYGPRTYRPRMAQTTPRERPSNLSHQHPRRALESNLNKRLCHPISGGAPFLLCHKCFRLLKLPHNFTVMQKNQYQLQCGACSAVVSFDLQNKSSGLLSSQRHSDSVDDTSGFNEVLVESGPKHHRYSCTATSTNLGSYDFDAVGYSFRTMESGTGELSNRQRSGSNLADNTRLSPSSSRSSKEERFSDHASAQSSLPNSAEMPLKSNVVQLPPGSLQWDHLDYRRKIKAGELKSHSGDEKQVIEKDISFESSVENTAVATESEVHCNEVPATSLYEDSGDVPGEENKAGNNKDRHSSLTAFMKRGFVSRPGHCSPGRAEVFGDNQPIQTHLVKKAEKLAGGIQPGEYCQRSGVDFADNTRLSPSSSRSSKEELFSDNESALSSLPNSAEMPLNVNLVRPPPGSPLRDHLDYSSVFRKIEAGEVKSYTRDEKQVIKKDTYVESSVETTVVATELEVHSNEVPATGLSEDSADVLEEGNNGNNKKGHSSLTAFMKRGFVSRPGPGNGSPGRAEVYVNNQPIQNRLVKRAEKLAGEIQPGEYWYDSKAGFWGVMGHRCLGIIPPFIQEFSFPMPVNCCGGDAAVYINGRELQKRDLDLLASRGLPTTSNKSYIVDISGKVMDEETKQFVVNLGKLAPTVERNKCGFGMQVPEDLDY